jgi:hypothetical protein
MSEVSYKHTKEALHTAAVSSYLLSTGVNPVLGTKPPDIYPSEESLTLVYCTSLAQLRSEKRSSLMSYQFFINTVNDANCPACPACHSAPQSTNKSSSAPLIRPHCQSLTCGLGWWKPQHLSSAFLTLTISPLCPLLPPPPPEPPP